MHAYVVSIGTEVVRGELVNTNAQLLAERLTELGLTVREHVSVADEPAELHALFARLRAQDPRGVLVSTGGLGPTTDDLTAKAVADFLGVGIVRDPVALEAITVRMQRAGRSLSESNASQADIPAGALPLPNAVGSAPGFCAHLGSTTGEPGLQAFFLPGVPREMRAMFEAEVVPRLAPHVAKNRWQVHLRTFGLPESQVGDRLAGIEAAYPGVVLGYRAHFPEIEVKVLATAGDALAARRLAVRVAAEVESKLHGFVYGGKTDSFVAKATEMLVARGLTVAVAESCTGGMLAEKLTSLPGAGRFMQAGVVSYANEAKTALLGVPAALIAAHGAVSEEVAAAMAEGIRARSGADLAVSITGVAGPDGGSAEKPVGTVCFGLADAERTQTRREMLLRGTRQQIRVLATHVALAMLRERALSMPTRRH